jgi:hypothetical protein
VVGGDEHHSLSQCPAGTGRGSPLDRTRILDPDRPDSIDVHRHAHLQSAWAANTSAVSGIAVEHSSLVATIAPATLANRRISANGQPESRP